jgi:Ca2+-binding RTX toxin-like protein
MPDKSDKTVVIETGKTADVAFSPDQQRVYATLTTGDIDVFDVATQRKVATWHVGTTLGAVSVSADGSYLLVSDPRQPLLYRVDSATGEVLSTFIGTGSAFRDIEIVDEKSAILTGSNPILLDLKTNTGTPLTNSANYSGNAVLTEDVHLTLFGETGISNGPLAIYDDRLGRIVARGDNYQTIGGSNSTGFNYGSQAISEAAGKVLQFIYYGAINIYDLTLKYQRTVNIGEPIAGMTFDPTGKFVYGYLASGAVVKYDSATFNEVDRFPAAVTTINSGTANYGNAMLVAEDGRHLVATDINTGQLQIIDITGRAETLTGTAGHDNISGGGGDDTLWGYDGSDQLYGDDGNDVLHGGLGNDLLDGGVGNDLLDGGMGSDMLSGGAGDDIYVIDNVGDKISELGGSGIDTVRASISYVLGAGLENLILTGTAAINATGNDAANYIQGNAGRNVLAGGAGDDTIVTVGDIARIKPDAGFDRIDGGSGIDTLVLGGVQSDYHVLNSDGHSFLVTARGATDVTGIEQGTFGTTAIQSWSSVLTGTAAFDGLSYIAGYSDLRAAFGANATSGEQHFLQYGFSEGRALSFNSLDYIASYSDLRQTLGTNATAGAEHFIQFGATENRGVSFDGWAYLASYSDLIQAFGANETAAAQHFIQFGAAENRTTSFNALDYAAANADLTAAFGTDQEALARHYVLYGYAEGRALHAGTSVLAVTAPDTAPADAGVATPALAATFVTDTGSHGDTGMLTGAAWLGTPDVNHIAADVFVIA